MAKNTTSNPYEEMLALLSDEERAALGKLTGQDNGGGGSKTPVIKINFNRSDVNGKKVNKGSFVVGQKNGQVDGKDAVLEIGTDLGSEMNAVILKVVTQYSYFSKEAKKRCSSQLISDRGEIPFGNNLKCRCNDKSCPRRAEGIDKTEKCSCQYIAFLRLPEGTKLPDGKECPVAMLYIKGTQFSPFKDYLEKDIKGIPTIALETTFSSTEEGAAVSYWQMAFKKGKPVSTEVFKENFAMVSGINKDMISYKEEQAQKMIAAPSSSSEGIVGKSGKDPVIVNGDDDNISW